jgi:hypothetical protein
VQQHPGRSSRKAFSGYRCSPGGYHPKKVILSNAAVLEKALTISQDLDDKDISLQVSGPGNGI